MTYEEAERRLETALRSGSGADLQRAYSDMKDFLATPEGLDHELPSCWDAVYERLVRFLQGADPIEGGKPL